MMQDVLHLVESRHHLRTCEILWNYFKKHVEKKNTATVDAVWTTREEYVNMW